MSLRGVFFRRVVPAAWRVKPAEQSKAANDGRSSVRFVNVAALQGVSGFKRGGSCFFRFVDLGQGPALSAGLWLEATFSDAHMTDWTVDD